MPKRAVHSYSRDRRQGSMCAEGHVHAALAPPLVDANNPPSIETLWSWLFSPNYGTAETELLTAQLSEIREPE